MHFNYFYFRCYCTVSSTFSLCILLTLLSHASPFNPLGGTSNLKGGIISHVLEFRKTLYWLAILEHARV